MKQLSTFLLLFIVYGPFCAISVAQRTNDASQNRMSIAFDKLLSQQFKSTGTGCAALVAREEKIIYEKAFGMADLELKIPMRPEMVFRIASMTKQFTSVAILQLAEKGNLSLQDDIKKFIPDYPAQGHLITIENLLTHTSGIKDYVTMSTFDWAIQMKDRTPEELVAFFKDQPLDFAPATKFRYSNSNYILLGYIIEKVSGQPYAKYMGEHIFKPLHMSSAYYDDTKSVIENRSPGYEFNEGKYVNAPYISMTHPFSDGGLMMSVEDYFKWVYGLHSYKLIKKETLDKAFRPFRLANGRLSNYGYGWYVKDFQGTVLYRHNGGINGFSCISMYLPREKLLVVAFSNCNCYEGYPLLTGTKMAALAMGKPFVHFKEMGLDSIILKGYEGIYRDAQGEKNTLSLEKGRLSFEEEGDKKTEIIPYEKDKFFFDEVNTVEFFRNLAGKIEKIQITRPTSNDSTGVWKRTEEVAVVHKEIRLPQAMLDSCTGAYEFRPGVPANIGREQDHLTVQIGTGPKLGLYAETESGFFAKEGDVFIEFVRGKDGRVSGLILQQGPARIEMKKLK